MTLMFELVFTSCGALCLSAMGVGSLCTAIFSLIAIRKFRDPQWIASLLPFAWLPAMCGCFRSLLMISIIVGVYQSADSGTDDQPEPMILIAMGVTPILCGILFSLPSYLILSVTRLLVLWPASPHASKGEAVAVTKSAMSTIEDPILAIHEQTDSYIAQLVQSRSPKIIPETELRLRP